MSGEYKLGELLYQATLNKDFDEAVETIREKYSVPKDGYKSPEDIQIDQNMVIECYRLQVAYGIPHTNPVAVYHYALYGIEDWDKYESHTEPFYIIEHPKKLRNDIEDLFTQSKQPYVKLLIPDYASQDDVKKYLSKKWPEIQEQIKKQSGGKSRTVRRFQNKNRDQLARKLFRQTKEQLNEEYSEEIYDNKPKEYMVANILSNHFDHKVSAEQVKKITSNKGGKK